MNMIVAFCKNRGIGFKNKIPWHIQNELTYFKKKTSNGNNNVVIMGRKTWESLPKKPLKNRKNIILSNSLNNNNLEEYDDTISISNFESLNETIEKSLNDTIGNQKIWLIGGKSIYDYYIEDPKLEKIYVTYINNKFKFDVQFPEIPNHFNIISNSERLNDNDINYYYKIYKNKRCV